MYYFGILALKKALRQDDKDEIKGGRNKDYEDNEDDKDDEDKNDKDDIDDNARFGFGPTWDALDGAKVQPSLWTASA